MSRTLLEKITSALVVSLTSVAAMGMILVIANGIFEWDIFPPFTEKIFFFIGSSSVVVIMAATLINIMLNISRLADNSSYLLFELKKRTKK